MAITAQAAARFGPEVYYPSSDGKPVGETDWHIDALMHLREALRRWFRKRRVYVATDMFLYYVEGDPRASVAPDVMMIKGVKKHSRKTFKTWEEKTAPAVIIELVSDTSVKVDLKQKPALYAGLGVTEYFVFDPQGDIIKPRLRGFRLDGAKYAPIEPSQDGSLTCEVFGLVLTPEGHLLRLTDAATGEPLLTGGEREEEAAREAEQLQQRAEQERQRAEQERQRRDALAAELEQLKAERAQQKPKKK